MTEMEFIKHEISIWGEEEIFNLIDRGFTPVQVVNKQGRVKWTWILNHATNKSIDPIESNELTNRAEYATI